LISCRPNRRRVRPRLLAATCTVWAVSCSPCWRGDLPLQQKQFRRRYIVSVSIRRHRFAISRRKHPSKWKRSSTSCSPKTRQVELAALLSQIGCITVPATALQKYFAGDSLTPEEAKIYNSHPKIGGDLLEQIPRMEAVTYMIKNQQKDAILLFRLGDFYEMFFDDAVLASKILEIALTSRDKSAENPIPLCGSIPPVFCKILVAKNLPDFFH